VLEATGSPAEAGLVGSVLAGTAFFLRLPAGVLADRWNRRAILLCCDAGRAASAAALAVALALGHFFFVQILLVAVVEAGLGVLFGPAESGAVRRVVAPDQIRDAVARNQSRSAVPGVVGPPIGGALLAAARSLPFVADAVSYLVSFVCIASVRRPLGGGSHDGVRTPLVASLFEGLLWIWRRRFLRALLLWSIGIGMVFNSIGLVTLVLARDRGASPSELGVMAAITSAGGVAGAIAAPAILRRVPRFTVILVFAWVAAAVAFGLLGADSPYLIGVLGGIAFLLAPAVNAIAFSVVADEAGDELQGRATSAAIQLGNLGGPVGPAVAGVLLGSLGATKAIVVYGCALLALAVAATVSRGLRAP
jgi:predicted MFS family arabinose efflux permease